MPHWVIRHKRQPIMLTAEMVHALTLAALGSDPVPLVDVSPRARAVLILNGMLREVTPFGARLRLYRTTKKGDNMRRRWANARPDDPDD